MIAMFNECYIIEYIDLSYFNTSKVSNMSGMFNKSHKLKEIVGIDKFNTSKVTNMRAMFNECNEIEYLNLSNFNTSNISDLSIMFQECFELKHVDISNFNTIYAKNISWMFNKCYKLKDIKGINILNNCKNINKTGIFEDCPKLKNNPFEGAPPPIKIEKKQITIIFNSINQIIQDYQVTCYNTDIFETLREKIYLQYPIFKSKDIYFLAKGNIINERVTLAENNIGDGTVIIISESI
jgi:surface protein